MLLQLAHQIWKGHLKKGDRVIDATCGNGYDAEFLSKFELGHLYLFDIQEIALERSRQRVGNLSNISFHLASHSSFDPSLAPISLIVYNLGYLPGGDKSLTTQAETTLMSFEMGLQLLEKEGLLSAMLYPGHEEGEREECAILSWAKSLSSKDFSISHSKMINRSKAPSILLIKKLR